MGENHHDIGFGYDVMDMTLKADTKFKKDKLDSSKIKNFCASKETIKKAKR